MNAQRLLVTMVLVLLARGALAQDGLQAKIGIPVRFEDVVIEGAEVEIPPCEAQSPLCARIVSVVPHGSARRYTIECTVLEAGDWEVRSLLRRRDGSSAEGLPALRVTARSVLAAGGVRPSAPGAGELPRFGGYRALAVAAGVSWILVLALVLWSGRRRRVAEGTGGRARPVTLSERLRVLVDRARKQELAEGERTQLEMSLVAYWRRRLRLEEVPAHDLLPRLRAHPEAGPLLVGLERWLHAPEGAEDVDVANLLAPYRDLPDDAIDLPGSA